MRIVQMTHKNQFVIYNEGATFFQSYDSIIAKYKNGKIQVTDKWCYSNTTLKHLYEFIREYTHETWSPLNEQTITNLITNGVIEVVDNL